MEQLPISPRKALSNLASADFFDAQCALVGRHSLAYAGPFSIGRVGPASVMSGEVIHGPLLVANVLTWNNALRKRNYTIYKTPHGNILHLQFVDCEDDPSANLVLM